jgi:hypothetical protein
LFWGVIEADTQFLCIPDMLKARPSEEGGRRFIYMEAANQALDLQGETVMTKALADSADYFLRFGNLDLDHITQVGPAKGIQDYPAFEIGRPVQVKVDGQRTMVKGEVASGDGKAARMANVFWDSIYRQKPAQRWYPSVGGAVMDRGIEMDPATKMPRKVIRAVRWTNIGFSKTPVNHTVPTVSVVPFGALAKSWGAGGLDIRKALEAGYGTDSATLSGGAALRKETADRKVQSYWDFRDRLSDDVLQKRVGTSPESLIEHASSHYGLDPDDAGEWTERFLTDLREGLKQRKGLH